MPNIKSAIKRVRTTENAEARNISQKTLYCCENAKTAINNNADNKAELVNFAIKSVDKASQSSNFIQIKLIVNHN